MDKVLYLFPDTNLFIQCRALGALDWSPWSEFSDVQLIVSRPVQREIDNQKNRGNDRVGRRARKTYQMFRRILLESDQDYLLVRETDPQVKLFLAGPGKPSSELIGILDYNKSDDELVGYIWEYRERYENRDVRLLTHDSGPMMTAKNIGLPFIPIPENWLLQPEPNESERTIRRLNEQIRQLQAGPKFEITFVDQHKNKIESVELSLQIPLPLSAVEIDTLMLALKEQFPQNSSLSPAPGLNWKRPDGLYHEWIDQCREIFTDLHKGLQVESRGVTFSVLAKNTGVSSARDVLVEINAMGKFLIYPLEEANEFESDLYDWRMSLPQPPQWMGMGGGRISPELVLPPRANVNYRRDANAFYYKPACPDRPVTSYLLECKQWRHGLDGEYFNCKVFIEHVIDKIDGAIECTIHADNLPTPVKAHVPVHIVIEGVNVVNHAKGLLADLES